MTRLFDALRWSPFALRAQALRDRWRRARKRGERTRGHCALCAREATFVRFDDNARENPVCVDCGSVPRQRALALVLADLGIDLSRARVHEASPSLGSWRFLRRRCGAFTASLWLPGVPQGARIGAFRCVDLRHQPFADGAFDLVITQDVLEHVPDPGDALREIARTLRPGGAHVFTVPRRRDEPTRARAEWRGGVLHHLAPAEYHRDPSTRAGTLVVTDWGMDLEAIVADRAGSACTARTVHDARAGIPVPVEVFVAHQP